MNKEINIQIIGQILLLLSSPTLTIRKLIWKNIYRLRYGKFISGMEYITLRRDLFWWAGSQIRTDVSLRIMITSQAESTTVPFRQLFHVTIKESIIKYKP